MQGTVPGEGLPQQVLETASLARAVFGTKLCSVLLYGSAALRGTRPDSDLDLLLVTEREMTQDERLQMTGRLLALSGPVGCRNRRPMEVTVFSRRDLLQVRERPGWQYQYGEWLRQELLRGALPQRSENPDAILLLWQAGCCHVPVWGRPAEEWLPRFSKEEIDRAMERSLPELLSFLKGDERNVLLTLSRMWVTAQTGELCSKDEAAARVLPALPGRLAPLRELARSAYLGEAKDNWEGQQQAAQELALWMGRAILARLAGAPRERRFSGASRGIVLPASKKDRRKAQKPFACLCGLILCGALSKRQDAQNLPWCLSGFTCWRWSSRSSRPSS